MTCLSSIHNHGLEVQSRLLKQLMVRVKCQGVFFQNTLVKFLLKSDSKLYQRNRRLSDCEELSVGYSQEMMGLVIVRLLLFYSIYKPSFYVSVTVVFYSTPRSPILPFTFVFKEYMIFSPVVKESLLAFSISQPVLKFPLKIIIAMSEFFHSISLWQSPHSICLIESNVAGSVFLGSNERST